MAISITLPEVSEGPTNLKFKPLTVDELKSAESFTGDFFCEKAVNEIATSIDKLKFFIINKFFLG